MTTEEVNQIQAGDILVSCQISPNSKYLYNSSIRIINIVNGMFICINKQNRVFGLNQSEMEQSYWIKLPPKINLTNYILDL